MTTPTGQISASDLRDEFGATNSNGQVSLGLYRVDKTVGELSELALDDGVPQSGQISYSNMRGKQLNVVVDFHTGGTTSRKNAKTEYTNKNVTYVGNFYTNTHTNPPTNGEATKVIIHVNKKIESERGNANKCALRTGTWAGDANVRVDVGGEGSIYGAGGNGGAGAGGESNGNAGENGTSALGVEKSMTVNIRTGGYIQAGYGGGGGGGGGYDSDKHDDELGSGGGGGGGAGQPFGLGGAKGDGWEADGEAGDNGTGTTAGEGGNGGNSDNEGIGGNGGDGGQPGEAANNGGGGSGNNGTGSGGAGGGNGAAVRRTNSGISISYTGETDRILGPTNQDGVA